jgi:hypothetical protein
MSHWRFILSTALALDQQRWRKSLALDEQEVEAPPLSA